MLWGLDASKHTYSGIPAWVKTPGAHLSTTPPQGCCAESASVLHVRAIHVQLPLVTSTATDSRDCEGATGFLYTFSLTALLTWSPGTDQTLVRDSEQQDLGWLIPLEPTTLSRPKRQMVLITIFAHFSTHLFIFYVIICFAFELWYLHIYFVYELLVW